MRTIERSNAFKKDYRRVKRMPRYRDIDDSLANVVESLVRDAPLLPAYRDHALIGVWSGYRECHLRPDLLLIYRVRGSDILELVRLGSHSELFR